jgi:hypothetical protein
MALGQYDYFIHQNLLKNHAESGYLFSFTPLYAIASGSTTSTDRSVLTGQIWSILWQIYLL